MRIGQVIGTVTLSRAHPTLTKLRWVIAVPYSLSALRENFPPDGEDVIIVDQLGAGSGQQIGFTEGTEAAAPFHPDRKPIDAYGACIIDQLNIELP